MNITTQLFRTVLLLGACSGFASAITVLNPSFETNTGVGGFPPPTDWTNTVAMTNLFTENTAEIGITTGGTGPRYAGTDGGNIVQDLGVAFLANSTYTVTLSIGNRPGTGNAEGLTLFGLQSSSAATDLGTFTVVAAGTEVAAGSFQDFTYEFTTGAVAPAGNVVAVWRATADASSASASTRGIVDNYRVDVVPEPSSSLLVLLGGVALLGVRRRSAK